jgi:protein SCO1/2
MKLMNRRNIVFLVLIILIAGLAVYEYTKPPVLNGVVIDPPKPMPNFTLSSVNGPTHLSDFRGKVTLIFFGYTNCKDICPATLAKMSAVFTELGDKTSDVRLVFISVDYKRDTPQTTAAFVSKFRPDFVGLTGSQAEIDLVTKDYGIYYKLDVPDASGDYEVEHTADVMVLDRQGQLEMTWSPDQQPNEIASDLGVLAKK